MKKSIAVALLSLVILLALFVDVHFYYKTGFDFLYPSQQGAFVIPIVNTSTTATTPTATFDSGLLSQNLSTTPTLFGTASNITQGKIVAVLTSDTPGGNIIGGSAAWFSYPRVTNGTWSVTVSPALAPGLYQVSLATIDTNITLYQGGPITVGKTTPPPQPVRPSPPPAVTTYAIMATAGVGGSVSPFGGVTVPSGGSQTYTITPASGYRISTVTIDGSNTNNIGNTYVFSNINNNHTIKVTFSLIQPTAYTITATVGVGGVISPSGTVSVTPGATQTFAIVPSSGYQIQSMMVDGKSVSVSSSYQFQNVSGNHTLEVSFVGSPLQNVNEVLTLTWNAVPGAVAYAVYLDGELQTTTAGAHYIQPANTLKPGSTYSYIFVPLFDAPNVTAPAKYIDLDTFQPLSDSSMGSHNFLASVFNSVYGAIRNLILAAVGETSQSLPQAKIKTEKTAPAPARTNGVTFSANPDPIDIGKQSTLSWNVTDKNIVCDFLNIAPGITGIRGIDATEGPGSQKVSPPVTYTYDLACRNKDKSSIYLVDPPDNYETVKVTPMRVDFSAKQNADGKSDTLTWKTIPDAGTGACTVFGGTLYLTDNGSGSTTVSPTEDTEYEIDCVTPHNNADFTFYGPKNFTVTAKTKVTVASKAAASIDINPQYGAYGDPVTVSWNSNFNDSDPHHTQNCSLIGPGVSESGLSGSLLSNSIGVRSSFTVDCYDLDASGNIIDSAHANAATMFTPEQDPHVFGYMYPELLNSSYYGFVGNYQQVIDAVKACGGPVPIRDDVTGEQPFNNLPGEPCGLSDVTITQFRPGTTIKVDNGVGTILPLDQASQVPTSSDFPHYTSANGYPSNGIGVGVTVIKNASQTGAVQIYADGNSTDATELDGKYVENSKPIMGVATGAHTVANFESFAGRYFRYEICTYAIGGTECTTPGNFTSISTCGPDKTSPNETICNMPINVEAGKVTKVVLKEYNKDSVSLDASAVPACLVSGAGNTITRAAAAFDLRTEAETWYPKHVDTFIKGTVNWSVKCDVNSFNIAASYLPSAIIHRTSPVCSEYATGSYAPVVTIKTGNSSKNINTAFSVINLKDKNLNGDWKNILTYLYNKGSIDHNTGAIDVTSAGKLFDTNYDKVVTLNEIVDFLTAANVSPVQRGAVNVGLLAGGFKGMYLTDLDQALAQGLNTGACIPNPDFNKLFGL